MAKTAAQAAANWSGSGARAQADYVAGVTATTKDWAGLTTAAVPRMVAGVNAAAANGRIQAGINRGGTQYWKSQTEKKAANYANGFAQGGSNYSAAAAKFIPAIANIVQGLPPRGDIMANLQRVQGLALGLHQLKGTLGAR
jgi:hypothetical protein